MLVSAWQQCFVVKNVNFSMAELIFGTNIGFSKAAMCCGQKRWFQQW
jgi:hypothetical protein